MLGIRILAVMVLAIGAGSTGIAAYGFFIALPPILSSVERTGQYLSDFRAPDIDLEQSVAKIRGAATNMPRCPDEQYGGCMIFDLGQTKAELESLAVSLEKTDINIQEKVASLEERIHQVAVQLIFVRPMATAIVGWMLAVSVMLVLSGVAFLLIDKKLDKRLYRSTKSVIPESEA